MAAFSYFRSLHDNIWTPFDPKPKWLHPLTIASAKHTSFMSGNGQKSSTAQRAEAQAPRTTSGHLAASGYLTAEDPGPASWSEAEELCELLIRLKEIELCNMIGETSGIPERK